MKESVRRIGVTLCVIGAVAIAIVTAHDLARYCGNAQDACLLAAVSFSVPEYQLAYEGSVVTSQTTPSESSEYPSMLYEIFTLVKIVGVYLVFMGVLVLIALELMELHYIRILMKKKRA